MRMRARAPSDRTHVLVGFSVFVGAIIVVFG